MKREGGTRPTFEFDSGRARSVSGMKFRLAGASGPSGADLRRTCAGLRLRGPGPIALRGLSPLVTQPAEVPPGGRVLIDGGVDGLEVPVRADEELVAKAAPQQAVRLELPPQGVRAGIRREHLAIEVLQTGTCH